ncbi:hypothetical protein CASFOL_014522 [Castilleja foliolosa]|uniref:Uncharacterized protein n=1 Tax=Castilleja foliolosa TaxID=1961234 RepID=A0ABD3DNQ2_9LAMI
MYFSSHHRRAQSESFFRSPDLDDILLDDVLADLNLDFSDAAPSLLPPPLAQHSEAKPTAHLRSLSVDADYFDGLGLDDGGPPPAAA